MLIVTYVKNEFNKNNKKRVYSKYYNSTKHVCVHPITGKIIELDNIN